MVKKYMVKPGDTVLKIIEKNNSSINKFEYNNDINLLKFIAGQTVLIPVLIDSGINLKVHKTVKNDTLNKISSKYKVTCDEIKYFNRYDSLILAENQEVNVEEIVQQVVNEFEN